MLLQEFISLMEENYSLVNFAWKSWVVGLTRFQKVRLDIQVTIILWCVLCLSSRVMGSF